MRPTLSPSTSCTWVPTKSSTLTSTLLFLLGPATGNALDDVLRDPELPVERACLLCLDVQLQIFTDGFDPRPGNSHRLVALGAPEFAESIRKATKGGMDAHPQCRAADENVGDAWLCVLSRMHHQPADPSHAALFAIDQLFVQDVAYQIHLSHQ